MKHLKVETMFMTGAGDFTNGDYDLADKPDVMDGCDDYLEVNVQVQVIIDGSPHFIPSKARVGTINGVINPDNDWIALPCPPYCPRSGSIPPQHVWL